MGTSSPNSPTGVCPRTPLRLTDQSIWELGPIDAQKLAPSLTRKLFYDSALTAMYGLQVDMLILVVNAAYTNTDDVTSIHREDDTSRQLTTYQHDHKNIDLNGSAHTLCSCSSSWTPVGSMHPRVGLGWVRSCRVGLQNFPPWVKYQKISNKYALGT